MRIRTLISLHQKIGLAAVLVVVMLSVTGIALNHTETFALKNQPVEQRWLYQWYGLTVPELKKQIFFEDESGDSGSRIWVAQYDQDIWVNGNKITQGRLAGFGKTQFGYALVLQQVSVLLSPDFELIDQIANPAGSSVLAVRQNPLALSLENQTAWGLNPDMTGWVEIKSGGVIGTLPENTASEALPNALRAKIEDEYFKQGLDWERVLLDLHSGRIFGSAGVFVIDFFAVLMVVLSLSGFLLYRMKSSKKR
ncbi:PepSY-associated TM helix domain-containing protein [Thiomicrorhabdus sp.]|uniref:PepSY-associated TM helix domain-containing protein n=1 Tax=Thiomicrorhabdus sp. TaxID=2039724 RepID=UPI0029C81AC5|nr:PepSY-associated TM helix domain-containing protein [Thiomicrorhabdus sp.]